MNRNGGASNQKIRLSLENIDLAYKEIKSQYENESWDPMTEEEPIKSARSRSSEHIHDFENKKKAFIDMCYHLKFVVNYCYATDKYSTALYFNDIYSDKASLLMDNFEIHRLEDKNKMAFTE